MAELLSNLIYHFREKPCLWDSNCRSYRDRYARENAIQQISQDMNLTADEVKTKWRSTRNLYLRKKKIYEDELMKSANGTGEYIEPPSWPFYKSMEFINVNLKRHSSSMMQENPTDFLHFECSTESIDNNILQNGHVNHGIKKEPESYLDDLSILSEESPFKKKFVGNRDILSPSILDKKKEDKFAVIKRFLENKATGIYTVPIDWIKNCPDGDIICYWPSCENSEEFENKVKNCAMKDEDSWINYKIEPIKYYVNYSDAHKIIKNISELKNQESTEISTSKVGHVVLDLVDNSDIDTPDDPDQITGSSTPPPSSPPPPTQCRDTPSTSTSTSSDISSTEFEVISKAIQKLSSDNQITDNKMNIILENQRTILSALQWANGSRIAIDEMLDKDLFKICENMHDMQTLNEKLYGNKVYERAVKYYKEFSHLTVGLILRKIAVPKVWLLFNKSGSHGKLKITEFNIFHVILEVISLPETKVKIFNFLRNTLHLKNLNKL